MIENIKNNIKTVISIYLPTNPTIVLKYCILGMILIVGIFLRLLPLKYGAYISEFDPYLQYYATKVIVDGIRENGISGVFEFFNHHIDLTWQPEGVDLGLRYYPGVPYFGAITYLILTFLGFPVTLTDIGIYLPVVFSVISILCIYGIGKQFGGDFVGLLSALFFSISPGVIPRSNLGWYDTDGIGLPFMLLSLYFYICGLKEGDRKTKVQYGLLSGLFAGLLGASWGAFVYLYAIYTLFTFIIIFFIHKSDGYEYLYIPLVAIMDVIVTTVPRSASTYLTGLFAILHYLSIILLISARVVNFKLFFRSNIRIFSTILAAILLVVTILPIFPAQIGGRAITVIYPFYRDVSRFVSTVQEQAGASFVFFFRNLLPLLPFTIYGYYLGLKRKTIDGYFILILTLFNVYVASNFVRLLIIAIPFLSIVGSYGVYHIFVSIINGIYKQGTKKQKYLVNTIYIKSILIIFSLLIIIVSTYFSYNIGVRGADFPVTIATGGSPFGTSGDWFEALEWMKANIPNDAIVASWWDYGYWISFIGGKKSLADNGTLNLTRITKLAEMFLSDEERALSILNELGADYVLIYLGTINTRGGQEFVLLHGFGEEGKFIQMAKIIGLDHTKLINRSNTDGSIYTDAFWNTFLGKLIPYEFVTKQGNIDIYRYNSNYPTNPNSDAKLVLVYKTNDPGGGEVVIYKINK